MLYRFRVIKPNLEYNARLDHQYYWYYNDRGESCVFAKIYNDSGYRQHTIKYVLQGRELFRVNFWHNYTNISIAY